MHDESEFAGSLALHVQAAVRPDDETARLASSLVETCWPGGLGDRSEPVARGWLRMWGPARIVVDVPRCGCAQGRCTICN